MQNIILNDCGVDISTTTIHRKLVGMKFSLKRLELSPIRRNTESTIDLRYNYAADFINLQNQFSDDQFFFLDEVGFSLSLRKTMGRSRIGEHAISQVSTIRSKNLSYCAAMSVGGIFYYKKSDTPYNTEKLVDFVKGFIRNLAESNITSGVIVLDNVRFHHSIKVAEELGQTNFTLLFLPPYSPFLNIIENGFSKWKNSVINLKPTNEDKLIEYINNAASFFTITDFQGYFRNMLRYISRSLLREEIHQ